MEVPEGRDWKNKMREAGAEGAKKIYVAKIGRRKIQWGDGTRANRRGKKENMYPRGKKDVKP